MDVAMDSDSGQLTVIEEGCDSGRCGLSTLAPLRIGTEIAHGRALERLQVQPFDDPSTELRATLADFAPKRGISSPVIVMALAGKDAIGIARNMMGATFGSKAAPGTIRGDLGVSNSFNLIHGSDSPESAARELALFFKNDELIDWTPASLGWIYDMSKGQPE